MVMHTEHIPVINRQFTFRFFSSKTYVTDEVMITNIEALIKPLLSTVSTKKARITDV